MRSSSSESIIDSGFCTLSTQAIAKLRRCGHAGRVTLPRSRVQVGTRVPRVRRDCVLQLPQQKTSCPDASIRLNHSGGRLNCRSDHRWLNHRRLNHRRRDHRRLNNGRCNDRRLIDISRRSIIGVTGGVIPHAIQPAAAVMGVNGPPAPSEIAVRRVMMDNVTHRRGVMDNVMHGSVMHRPAMHGSRSTSMRHGPSVARAGDTRNECANNKCLDDFHHNGFLFLFRRFFVFCFRQCGFPAPTPSLSHFCQLPVKYVFQERQLQKPTSADAQERVYHVR